MLRKPPGGRASPTALTTAVTRALFLPFALGPEGPSSPEDTAVSDSTVALCFSIPGGRAFAQQSTVALVHAGPQSVHSPSPESVPGGQFCAPRTLECIEKLLARDLGHFDNPLGSRPLDPVLIHDCGSTEGNGRSTEQSNDRSAQLDSPVSCSSVRNLCPSPLAHTSPSSTTARYRACEWASSSCLVSGFGVPKHMSWQLC